MPPQDQSTGMTVTSPAPLTQSDRVLTILRDRTLPHLKPSNTAASRCICVALVHFIMGQGGEQAPAHINTIAIDERLKGDELDEELVRIANSLTNEAIYHASSMPNSQSYGIILYGRGDFVLQQHRFNAGPPTKSLTGGETEPANIYGIAAQQMRHTEITMRMQAETIGATLELLQEENHRLRASEDKLRGQLESLYSKRLEMFDLIETLKDGKAKRDLEAKEAELMAERGERIFELLEKKLLPELLAKYSANAPAKTVLDDLSIEQVVTIAGTLNDRQKKAFWALLPEEKQAELAAIAASAQNGAAS